MKFTQNLWMIRCVLVFAVTASVFVTLLPEPAGGQSIFASIVGTVRDPSSGVIPGAKVSATNTATNERRSLTTDSLGYYEINNLFPGVYVLEIEMAGFSKYRNEKISLASNENARVDVTLQVSAEVTQVTVSSEGGPRIETESAKLGDVRSLKQLQTLPLGERSMWRYLVLTPGVTGGMNGTMSVSGSRSRQVDYAVDGVTMSDVRSSNTIGPTLNFIEAFEEANISMGNNSAEFKALGTLTVATKRGGNELHGAVYDYYGTGAFRARNFFTHQRSGTPSHGFGGHISGPVYVPGVYDGRNKTFWFTSYETTFAPQAADDFNITVPLAAWKLGDFSSESTVVKDPFNGGAPFANNKIPADRISNVAKQYFPMWPAPNYGNPAVFSSQNYRAQHRRPFSKPHNSQTRIDHRISDKNTIFGRYLYQWQTNPGFESGLPGGLGLRNQVRIVKHVVLSDTHVFSPTLINEARFGIAYNTNPYWAKDVDGPAFIKATGLTNVTRDGKIPEVHEVPIVRFTNGPAIQTIEVINHRLFNEDITFQWQDTLSVITGKHSMRFGVEINKRHFNDQNHPTNVFGNFQFSNAYTGFNFADFVLGIPTSISRAAAALPRQDRSIAYDFFFQDSYRITSSLTLNLGLRYELHPGWTTSGSRISAFDKTQGAIVVPDAALPLVSDLFPTNVVPVIGHSKTKFNDRLFETDMTNFAPRVGFAWRPLGAQTFVIRGGYGIFYESIPRQQSLFSVPFIVNEPSFTNPRDINNPQFVQWPLAFPRVTSGAGVSIPGTWERGFRTPYAQNWSLTLEKEVLAMAVRASYVGTGGRQMPFPFNINQPAPGPGLYINKPRPFPALSAITEQRNGASHTYHAVQFEAERRFSNGLMYQTSFIFAKDLGDEDVTPENTYDRARERGQTQIQPYRRWIGFLIYELPFGKGKPIASSVGGIGRHLLSGWELSASAAMQDGQNETPLWQMPDIHGIAHTTSSTPPSVAYRPNCLYDPNLPGDQRTIQAWYDVKAFALPTTPGVFGSCGRSVIMGPGVRVLHGGLFKTFSAVGERFRFRVGTQITNILNHPNWSNLSSSALRLDSTSSRAQITGAGGATSSSAGDAAGPRVIRLDLRVEF